jgi:hypothetical protein
VLCILIVTGTPATLELLMIAGWRGDAGLHVLCGGEAFRLNLAPLTTRCRYEGVGGFSYTAYLRAQESLAWAVSCLYTRTCSKAHSPPVQPASHTPPFPCRSFRNVYGPTETTIWSSCQRFTSEPTGSVPIGSPIANTQLYVLDESKRQCKAGQSGEKGAAFLGKFFPLPCLLH